MPLYCINQDKVFQCPDRLRDNQSYLLEDVIIEDDWMDYLAEELERYDGSVSWYQRINYHLNNSEAQGKADTFKVIYARLKGRLDARLSPLTVSEAQGIVQYLSDGIDRCTQGILERAQMFVASIQLPESVDEYLCLARTQMIEDMVYSGISSQNIHDKAVVFKWANEAGYAINIAISDEVRNTNIGDLRPTIVNQMKELMGLHYQYHSWPDLIIQQFKDKNLVYKGYYGYKEAGYNLDEFNKFLKAISQLLDQSVGYNFLVMNADCDRVYDIDWALVRQQLWHKLVNDEYVINPEPDYTQLNNNSNEKTKAVYYFLALAKNDPDSLEVYCNTLKQHGYLRTIVEHAIEFLQFNMPAKLDRVLYNILDNELLFNLFKGTRQLRTKVYWNAYTHGQTLMHYAADLGCTKVIDRLSTLGAKVNIRNTDGQTPLHKAIIAGHDYLVGHLLQKSGVQLNTSDKQNGMTPLHYACLYGQSDIVTRLIQHNPKLLWQVVNNDVRSNCLHLAAQQGHLAIIRQLVEWGDELSHKQTSKGDNIAHLAAAEGHEAIIRYIFSRDDNQYLLGMLNNNAQTVLHAVANAQSSNTGRSDYINAAKKNIIRCLIDQVRLNSNWADSNGDTVLHQAISNQQFVIARYLVACYGDRFELNKFNLKEQSPLMLALQNGGSDIANKLLDSGVDPADIDALAKQYNSSEGALHYLARQGYGSLIARFIATMQLDSDAIDSRNRREQTPLCIAAHSNQSQAFQKLIEHQADPVTLDVDNNNCLHYLLQHNNWREADRLLKTVDDNGLITLVKTTNNQGKTPLHLAFSQGNINLFNVLYDKGLMPYLAKSLFAVVESSLQGYKSLLAWFMNYQCWGIIKSISNDLTSQQVAELFTQRLDHNSPDKVYYLAIRHAGYTFCDWMIQSDWFDQINTDSVLDRHVGMSLIHCLIAKRNDDQVPQLVERWLLLDKQGLLSRSWFDRPYLFIYAAENLHQGSVLIDLIVQHYPSYINQRMPNGKTALHIADELLNEKAVDTLLNYKVDTTIGDCNNHAMWRSTRIKDRDKLSRPVPMANITWQSSYIEQQQVNANSPNELCDHYINYNQIDSTYGDNTPLARAYFIQLTCYEPSKLSQYISKLRQYKVLNRVAKLALMHLVNQDPGVLGEFLNLLQQQEQLEHLSGLLDNAEGKHLLNSIVHRKADITLEQAMFLISTSCAGRLLSKPSVVNQLTLLDMAVIYNDAALVDQILTYSDVYIDLHRQLDNIENSDYEPVDMLTIMDKLCHYGGGQNVQHDGYEFILDRVLNEERDYFDLGLAIIRHSNAINVNRELGSSSRWEQFLRYAAKKGESKLFQLTAYDDILINTTNWEAANVGYAVASCTNECASKVIDSLITISRSRRWSIFSWSLLRICDSQGELPLHRVAWNFDQSYHIVDKLIERGVPLDLKEPNGLGFSPLELAAYIGNKGFVQRLIQWLGHQDAPRDLEDQLHYALFISCQQGCLDIIELFESEGLAYLIHQYDKAKQTALHWAAKQFQRPYFDDSYTLNPGRTFNDSKQQIIDKLHNWYGIHFDQQDRNGQTPLSIAVNDNCEAIVWFDEFVDWQAQGYTYDCLIRQFDSRTYPPDASRLFHPLHTAAKLTNQGAEPVKKWLTRCPNQLNVKSNLGATPLYMAAQVGNSEAVSYLLDQEGVQCDIYNIMITADDSSNQLLHWLVEHRDSTNFKNVLQKLTSEQLISHLNNKNTDNVTPLQMAIQKGYIEFMDIMVQFTNLFPRRFDVHPFAFLDKVNPPSGEPILKWLHQHECHRLIQYILDKADIASHLLLQKDPSSGQHVLWDFVCNNLYNILNYPDSHHILIGCTALSQNLGDSIVKSHDSRAVTMVEAFIKAHEVDMSNESGITMSEHDSTFRRFDKDIQLRLHVAAANLEQGRDLVSILAQKYPSDMYQVNYKGQTPMHVAAEKGNLGAVQMLKSLSQASLDLHDFRGRTPKQTAIDQGHFAVADLLNQAEYNHRLTSGNGHRSFVFGGAAADNAHIPNQTPQPGKG